MSEMNYEGTPVVSDNAAEMMLKEALIGIAKALVSTPDSVSVEEEVEGNDVTLILSVAPDDMGMVIGRHGRIAKAIRSVMKAAANNCGKRVTVEIK